MASLEEFPPAQYPVDEALSPGLAFRDTEGDALTGSPGSGCPAALTRAPVDGQRPRPFWFHSAGISCVVIGARRRTRLRGPAAASSRRRPELGPERGGGISRSRPQKSRWIRVRGWGWVGEGMFLTGSLAQSLTHPSIHPFMHPPTHTSSIRPSTHAHIHPFTPPHSHPPPRPLTLSSIRCSPNSIIHLALRPALRSQRLSQIQTRLSKSSECRSIERKMW